ncbi:MAG: CPBP family intramembrane metalloprotease [Bacteroidia bacterium]|nr:CPBP family intramembrane metalloprotease [Bacteroidia bacterium]
MNEITRKSKPLWAQWLFVFGWLAVIVGLSSIGDGSDDSKVAEGLTPGVMRFSAVFQDILIFISPVIVYAFLFRSERFSLLTLGKRIHPLWFLSAIFVVFFSLPLVSWLGEINSEIKIPASLHSMEDWMKTKETAGSKMTELLLADRTTVGIISNILVMALLAAFSEELFFRGMMQRLLIDTKINAHVAIWITAIIFSAIHMQFYGFFPRMVLGAFLGYLFYFTGSLWISIIAHFLNNALYVAISYFSEETKVNPLEKSPEDPDMQISWSMAALSAMLVIGVFIFLKRMNPKEEMT